MYVKIVAKHDFQNVSFSLTETKLYKWQNPVPNIDDKTNNKENQENLKGNNWREESKDNDDGKSFL